MKIDFDFKKNKAVFVGGVPAEIREHFSISNPAARFSKSWFTPKRLYTITPNGYFDVGLIYEIQKFSEAKNLKTIELSETVKNVLNPSLNKSLIQRLSIPLRDYQEIAVKKCMEAGRGVCIMGTGAGKTLTMASLIDNFYLYSSDIKNFKCLVIVPDLSLVNQTFKEFKEYNVSFDVTMWTGSIKPDLNCNVIIANIAILQSKFFQNEWLRSVNLVIIDEAHKLSKGNKIVKIVDLITTVNKFGFTGTLPECNLDKWNVLGKVGPVLIEKSSYELRSSNYLVNVEVKVLNINYKIGNSIRMGDSETAFPRELEYIYNSDYRNNLIKKTCDHYNNNILILVNHITHGEILFKKLSEELKNKNVFFIRGDVDVNDRDKVKNLMEVDNNIICIAISSIFSTGINISNIHYIIFASGGKSFVRTVQSIGRGLRLNQNKNKLLIFDFADNLYYGKKHSDRRKEIYDAEKISYSEHSILEK
jgi:superfamily II DNA or RNA helicase